MIHRLNGSRRKPVSLQGREKLTFYHQCTNFKDRPYETPGNPLRLQSFEGLVGQKKECRFIIIFPCNVFYDLGKIVRVAGRLHIFTQFIKKSPDVGLNKAVGTSSLAELVIAKAKRQAGCHNAAALAARARGKTGNPPSFTRQEDDSAVIFSDG